MKYVFSPLEDFSTKFQIRWLIQNMDRTFVNATKLQVMCRGNRLFLFKKL